MISQLFFETKTKKDNIGRALSFSVHSNYVDSCADFVSDASSSCSVYLGCRFFHKNPPAITARLVMFSALFLSSYNMFIAPGFFNLSVEKLSHIRILGISGQSWH